jgi:hypothetical protein
MATRRRNGEMLKGRTTPEPRKGRGTCHVGRHTFFRPGKGQYSVALDVDTTIRAKRTQE